MSRAPWHQRLSAALLCGLLAPAGFAQNQTQAPAQTPPAPAQTVPPAPAPAAAPASPSLAQQIQQEQHQPVAPQQPFHVTLPHSRNPFAPYMPSIAPPLNLQNSPRLQSLMRDGKLYISLQDAIDLAIENNLDLAYSRYTLPTAQMDLARTMAGGVANGVNTGVVSSSTQNSLSAGSTPSGAGGQSSGAGAAGAGGLVTSTLGEGTYVEPFDPVFSLQALVDHTKTQEVNTIQYGVPLYEQNTVGFGTAYQQYFPTGMGVNFTLSGERQASNSPESIVNPDTFLNYKLTLTQPLLAGFGTATNKRWIRIAKKNLELTDYAFKAQVIATVTGVEDIYWDLVNAYQDEQIKTQSLGFANQTMTDDQKQLELKAIPAMQVMTDQAAVATAEGNLTVSRADLKAAELNLKNALTKTDDPALDDMPVIPLDKIGPSDPNAGKPIDALIVEAEKNRPDVSQDQIGMQVAQMNLKAINNELLPSLNAYGLFGGYGTGGPLNPHCDLGTYCTTNLPSGTPGVLADAFNYSSPEYQVGFTLNITIRNRIAKADQYRAQLGFRQAQISYEQQKKNIRFDVRNSQFALEQAQARVDASQKARDLAERTFDITQQEQKLGAKSSLDTLAAQNALAVTESTLDLAQTQYEKAKVDIDRATGETLERTGVSIDDAKTGVVTHAP
ncbi:MAG TPA: TolC family protein [Acidobacteriaceae bacterium]|nr:TolC family protein [Acidobacteriaceae bacterium]